MCSVIVQTPPDGKPPETAEPALAVFGLRRREGRGKRARTILHDMDAVFAQGALTALVGADGAGKSTLMRIMAGILPPTGGEVRVFGENLYADVARLQNHIGYMPQKFGLYEDLSVAENFALYADLFGLNEETRRERVTELLRMTGLAPFTERPAGKLSGGMKQKLGLACALLNHPKILLLDEPIVGVDPLSRKELWEILERNAHEEGMSVVVATTYMDEAALCDAVIILEEGKKRLAGTPGEIASFARGRTYFVSTPAGVRVRDLQAALLDDAARVVDAVPEAGGVRLLLAPGVKATEIEERLRAAFPGAGLTAREPTVEDGYLQKRRELLSAAQPLAAAAGQQADFASGADKEAGGTRSQSANRDAVICARNLKRTFGDFVAVDDTTFDVHEGEIFGLLGPNGAGKTTTFKMLCGLIEVSGGELTVAGVDVRNARALARESIGYMSQKFALYGNLSVRQNFDFFAGAYLLSGRRAQERIRELAETFGLTDVMEREAGSLPGGYKQRLAMAVALLHRPKILFLDEPTSGADIPTRRQFWRWMTALSAAGTTIVMTTHFMEEALYCDRILIQDAGKALVLGTPSEVRAENSTMNEAFVRIVSEARARTMADSGKQS